MGCTPGRGAGPKAARRPVVNDRDRAVPAPPGLRRTLQSLGRELADHLFDLFGGQQSVADGFEVAVDAKGWRVARYQMYVGRLALGGLVKQFHQHC